MKTREQLEEETGGQAGLKSSLVSRPRAVFWSALKAGKHGFVTKPKPSTTNPTTSGGVTLLVVGLVCCLVGVASLLWKPYDLLISERLVMRRGLPPFEWWAVPPDEVFLSVYVFNVTNSHQFLSGQSAKLRLQEIGPIVYREKLTHTDIEKQNDRSLSYTATRSPVYEPHLNHVDLNASLVVPNIAVLGMTSYLWNASYPIKFGFNLLMNQLGSKALIPLSIHDFLWNMTDPLVKATRTLAPFIVPTNNFGLLKQIYTNYEYSDRISMLIGKANGPKNFMKIDSLNGRPGLGVWHNDTCDSVQGSSEGVGYHQDVSPQDKLFYYRRSFCRTAPLHYTEDRRYLGMKMYKFELDEDLFARPPDGAECYLQPGLPSLPSGLTDASPCYFNFPLATSLPHFLGGDPALTERLEGLRPNYSLHHSYIIVEPNTGVPFTAAAKIQCNLVIRPIRSGFPKLKRFFNMSIPLFWAEYKQVDLPWKIKVLAYLVVVVLKEYQTYISAGLVVVGALLCLLSVHRPESAKTASVRPEPTLLPLLDLKATEASS